MAKGEPWALVERIEYFHLEDGKQYFHDFEDRPLLSATKDGQGATLQDPGLWARSGPDSNLYFQNPPTGRKTMARRKQARYTSGPKKGQFKPSGRKKSTRRRNPATKARSTTTARRRTTRAAPAQRRRRNPPRLDPIKKLMQGATGAVQILAGEAAARSLPAMAGINKGGNLGLAIQGLVALIVGMGAEKFVGREAGKMVLAGGLSAPLKTLIVTYNIPLLAEALSPASAQGAINGYSMGGYSNSMAGYSPAEAPALALAGYPQTGYGGGYGNDPY